MKKLVLIMATLLFAVSVGATNEFNLPELHVIKQVVLSPSYSCRSTEESQTGYAETALFLSDHSKRMNSPDLLFNGACKGEDYFEASTAGDDMALIAELGRDVTIEKLTAHNTFNLQNVHSFPAYTKFARVARVENNRTYAVLLNKSRVRGLFIFTVVDYVPNKRVELRYAVKEYQVLDVKAQSPGFDWEKENAEKLGANKKDPQ